MLEGTSVSHKVPYVMIGISFFFCGISFLNLKIVELYTVLICIPQNKQKVNKAQKFFFTSENYTVLFYIFQEMYFNSIKTMHLNTIKINFRSLKMNWLRRKVAHDIIL